MSFSPEQLAILALVLVIGLCLGYLGGSGGKWKARYRELDAERRDLRAERDAEIKDRDVRIEAANKRIAELESGGSRTGIGAGTAAAVAGGVRGTDDLTRINGVDHNRQIALNEAGYHRLSDVHAMKHHDEVALEGRLGLTPGTIAREQWREQAKDLARSRAAI